MIYGLILIQYRCVYVYILIYGYDVITRVLL